MKIGKREKTIAIMLVAATAFGILWILVDDMLPKDDYAETQKYCSTFFDQNNHCPFDECGVSCNEEGCRCLPLNSSAKEAEINFTALN